MGDGAADNLDDGVSDAGDVHEGLTFEVERVADHRVSASGEPQYLVEWKGYGPMHNSWEPWTSLTMCATMTAKWHNEQRKPPAWSANCPTQFETDAELPSWRVHSKRSSAGKVSKIFFGPRGEMVRSRSSAVQIHSLYGGKIARTFKQHE